MSATDDKREEFLPSRVMRPREQVEHQIREAILSGTFKGGDKLPSETALASRFSVSRTTVREALRSLVEAGFITKVPGVTGGSFVRTFDHRSLGLMLQNSMDNVLKLGSITPDEVASIRLLLEVPAAELAATNRTDAQVERLRAIVALEKETDVDDPRVPELDSSFHSTLAEASGNRPLAAFVSALHHVTKPVEQLALSAEVGREAVKHHIALVRAVERRDAASAAKAMATHLDYLRAASPGAGPNG